jgi:hypothetical protein
MRPVCRFPPPHQPVHERGIVTYPIDGHLDAQRAWIGGAFPDEAFHAGIEAFVGNVDKHVPALDQVSNGSMLTSQHRGHARSPRCIAEIG